MINIEKHKNFLDRLVSYLNSSATNLSSSHTDGRINSIDNESEIIDLIQEFYKTNKYEDYELNLPPDRFWYDIAFRKPSDKNDILPINIKVTKGGTDNISSKEGIFYALTGKDPAGIPLASWGSFMHALDLNIDLHLNPAKDYYFLIVLKKRPFRCYWTSLKSLKELVQNPNNLPFQSNWTINEQRIVRNNIEAFKFVLTNLMGSHAKRVDISAEVVRACNEICEKMDKEKNGK